MGLTRRLTLYLFGLIIGGGAAYLMYGERLTGGAWLPEQKVKLRLINTLTKAAPSAQAELDRRSLGLQQLREAIPSSDIRFRDSRRTEDSLIYAVDVTLKGVPAHLTIGALRDTYSDRDSTATLLSIR
ncbi:MAG: hypothetical protein IPL52_11800 [Flavobacteriales bacterium]|nr:hypothetical protein [Flavobacteriales bacterium]